MSTQNPPVAQNPEIGHKITTGEFVTNYHDVGSGEPILLLHGSGPGVSGFVNWRLVMEHLRDRFRLLVPDFAGFGYTEFDQGATFHRDVWLQQMIDFLDALGLERVNVVGNSFGGSMALALAIHHPQRVNKLILMGSVGVEFELTDALDRVWGYQPSFDAMQKLMRHDFAYDASRITDEMVQLRYEASRRPGMAEAFSSMFPAPRQRWVDSMAHPEEAIRAIGHETLLVHGRDDKVIPLQTSLTMLDYIEKSRLHVFGRCGHWTQIEWAPEFSTLVAHFISGQ